MIVKLDLLVSIVLGDIPNQVESGDLINFVDNEDLRKKSLTPDRISSWPLFHIQTTSSGESWSAISVVIVSFRRV